MQQNDTMKQFLIPISIIVAGGLIAAGVFFGDGASTSKKAIDSTIPVVNIDIKPVSSEEHIIGSANAKIVMVEFSDTECPFCKQYHSTMHKIVDTYGKDGTVAWVYRHFPIEQLHSKAIKEAEATECAYELGGEAGFWKYTDRLYEITPSNNGLDLAELPKIAAFAGLDVAKFNECLSSGRQQAKVQADYEDAAKAGGNGTPYTVFLLKKDLSKDALAFISDINSRFPRGQEPISISEDERKVGMSGAMQFSMVSEFIELLNK